MSRLLPGRIPGHLLRMRYTYEKTKRPELVEILSAARCYVQVDAIYDGYDGGSHGHAVLLYLPIDVITAFDIQETKPLVEKLLEDLRTLSSSVPDEFVSAVYLELDSDQDDIARLAVPISERRVVDPSTVDFWAPGHIRVFISHRDAHKKDARHLSDELKTFGISSFVAHDTITPMKEWRHEIMKGLETMELMLLFVTDDFQDSAWTNQEVGFALGRGIPIVSLKLGQRDPPGFVSHVQAQRGQIEDPRACAARLLPLVHKALGKEDRIVDALVTSFVNAPSYSDAKDRFEALRTGAPRLSDDHISAIQSAYRSNGQLTNAAYLSNSDRLVDYLRGATGSTFTIEKRQLLKVRARGTWEDDEIPF